MTRPPFGFGPGDRPGEPSDGNDPFATFAPLLDASGAYAISDSAWALQLLGLQQALPGSRYVSMTGARHALEAQAAVAHNLANVNSSGFRAQLNALRAVHLFGEGMPTRSYVVDSTVGTDFRPGTIQQTGHELDVAVMSRGFLAVQLPDGSEGYTRAGGLRVGPNGVLESPQGYPVLGVWSVDGKAAGMGIREDGLITGNRARFVPHVIL